MWMKPEKLISRTMIGLSIILLSRDADACRLFGFTSYKADYSEFLGNLLHVARNYAMSLGPDSWGASLIIYPFGQPVTPRCFGNAAIPSTASLSYNYCDWNYGLNAYTGYSEFISGVTKRQPTSMILHFRKGTSGPLNIPDPHPFIKHDYLGKYWGFAHNGFTSPNIKADVLNYLQENCNTYSQGLGYGSVDSEVYFSLFLCQLEVNQGFVEGAVWDTLRIMEGFMHGVGYLNFLFQNGDVIYALHYVFNASDSLGQYDLYYIANNPYYRVVASTINGTKGFVPLTQSDPWILLENGYMAVLRPCYVVKKVNLSPGSPKPVKEVFQTNVNYLCFYELAK